ncbi:MAG TPA: hypothetical protein VEY88_17805 [Archangium sp.]|nr:hypothetical protein [Archangium sp.]
MVPTAPHLINPRVPRSLGDIALKLLEKRPEARYPDAKALLQALWEAGKERTSPAWKQPLLASTEEAPLEATVEEKEAWLARRQQVAPRTEETVPVEEAQPREETRQEVPVPREPRTWRTWRRAGVSVLLLSVLFLASVRVRATLPPARLSEPTPSTALEKGTAPVTPSPTSPDATSPRDGSRLGWLAVWLCTATGLGCPAAQVRPEPANCSDEAQRNTFEVLKLDEGMWIDAVVDIHQPGEPSDEGTYRDGPIVSRVVGNEGRHPELPDGTLLYGRLWTGPGIQNRLGEDAVLGRYTEALLPDGRKFPVCMVLGGPEGLWAKEESSRPGVTRLDRVVPIAAVRSWP